MVGSDSVERNPTQVLRSWTEEWDAVARRVGAEWDGDPYTPADFENALCIWQERRFDDFVPSRSAASEDGDGRPLSRC